MICDNRTSVAEWYQSKRSRRGNPAPHMLAYYRQEKKVVQRFLKAGGFSRGDFRYQTFAWLNDCELFYRLSLKGHGNYKERLRNILKAIRRNRFIDDRLPNPGEPFYWEPNTLFVIHSEEAEPISNFHLAVKSGHVFEHELVFDINRETFARVRFDLQRRRAHGLWTCFFCADDYDSFGTEGMAYFIFENSADAVYLMLRHGDTLNCRTAA